MRRCGSGMGCGGAEEEAVDKLLSPLKNSNRVRHLSIIASNRSSTPSPATSDRLSLFRQFRPAGRSPRVPCVPGPRFSSMDSRQRKSETWLLSSLSRLLFHPNAETAHRVTIDELNSGAFLTRRYRERSFASAIDKSMNAIAWNPTHAAALAQLSDRHLASS